MASDHALEEATLEVYDDAVQLLRGPLEDRNLVIAYESLKIVADQLGGLLQERNRNLDALAQRAKDQLQAQKQAIASQAATINALPDDGEHSVGQAAAGEGAGPDAGEEGEDGVGISPDPPTPQPGDVGEEQGGEPTREVDVIEQEIEVARDAAFTLSVLLTSGLAAPVVPRNDSLALHYLILAAQGGDRGAEAALADRQYTARGTPLSCQDASQRAIFVAERLAREAEASGDVALPPASVRLKDRWLNASYVHASKAFNSEDQITWEEELAKKGDLQALVALGYRRLIGEGVPQDFAEARRFFRQAALQGEPNALYNLGYMDLRGAGGPVDHVAARRHLEAAAGRNHALAVNALATMHLHGQGGLEANASRAVEIFERGYRLGDPDSTLNLGLMYAAGAQGVERNVTRAIELMEDAYARGNWKAPLALAIEFYRFAVKHPEMWTDYRLNLERLQEILAAAAEKQAVPGAAAAEGSAAAPHPHEQGAVRGDVNAPRTAEHEAGVQLMQQGGLEGQRGGLHVGLPEFPEDWQTGIVRFVTRKLHRLVGGWAAALNLALVEDEAGGEGYGQADEREETDEADGTRFSKYHSEFVPLGTALLASAPELYRHPGVPHPPSPADLEAEVAAVALPRDALYPFLPGGVLQPRCGRIEALLRLFLAERMHWSDSLDAAVETLDRGDEWVAVLEYASMAEEGSEVAAANLAFLLQRILHRKGDLREAVTELLQEKADRAKRILQRAVSQVLLGAAEGETDGGPAPEETVREPQEDPAPAALFLPIRESGVVAREMQVEGGEGGMRMERVKQAGDYAPHHRRIQGAAVSLRYLMRSAVVLAPDSLLDIAQTVRALRAELLTPLETKLKQQGKAKDPATLAALEDVRSALVSMLRSIDGLRGLMDRSHNDLDRLAFLLTTEAAIWGDWGAINDAAWALLKGQGTPPDPKLARAIFRYLASSDQSLALTFCGWAGMLAVVFWPNKTSKVSFLDLYERAASARAGSATGRVRTLVAGPHWAQWENVVLSILIVAFTSVMWLRSRRLQLAGGNPAAEAEAGAREVAAPAAAEAAAASSQPAASEPPRREGGEGAAAGELSPQERGERATEGT